MTAEEHQLLDEFVSSLYGIHFPAEKKEILASRLESRLLALHLRRYLDYYLLLQYDSAEEIALLAHLVSNNETYFFRETLQFEALLEEGLQRTPAPSGREPIRLLCAGCSSGEEPYTINIFATEHSGRLMGRTLEIDGLDIDSMRLDIARKAVYGRRSLRSASEDQIRRCFSRNGADHYDLRERFRANVEFHHGNILDASSYPRSSYQAIFCRNVLIYFSEAALQKAVDNFAQALIPGGLLFLGHSESIIGLSDKFKTVRLDRCIAYQRV
jgi:chemotaxis protein methyltransferase CheR